MKLGFFFDKNVITKRTRYNIIIKECLTSNLSIEVRKFVKYNFPKILNKLKDQYVLIKNSQQKL